MKIAAQRSVRPRPRGSPRLLPIPDGPYLRFIETTHDGVCLLDEQSRVVFANGRLCQMLGYSHDELIGRVGLNLVEEPRKKDFTGFWQAAGDREHELALRHKNGRIVWTSVRGTPMLDEDGQLSGLMTMFSDITERRASEDRLRGLAEQQAHDEADRLMQAELEEQARSLALFRDRERIAMDLHDGVIQSLYGIALRLGALRREMQSSGPGEDGSVDGVLGSAISELTETIQGIREYIYDLRVGLPEVSDVRDGLSALADEASKSGLRPRLHIEADASQVTPEVVNHLLYIAHEALSNVIRHADATNVDIMLLPVQDDGLVLTIADNGKGFDPVRRGRRLGDGLNNIRRRARLIDARLTIDSQLGSGTIVSVRIP